MLLPAPDAAFDPRTGVARVGSFRGGLPRVDLSPMNHSVISRVARHKRWMYVAIASEDLFIGVCVVRLGYAANAFAFAFDKTTRKMLVDRTSLGPPFACEVGDAAGEGCIASYRLGTTRVAISRSLGSTAYTIEANLPDLEIEARIDAAAPPPALTAIAPIATHLLNTTEKRTLLAVTGSAKIAGRRRSLDGAIAGYDYTNGMLAHHTAWRWAFALGRATTGERIALNLVQGFVGEAECAAWTDGEVHALPEGRFVFDTKNPLAPWRVSTPDSSVDLRFEPGGIHAEHRNLGIVSSRFIHPVGTYSGTLKLGTRVLTLDRVLGVAEDQDVKW